MKSVNAAVTNAIRSGHDVKALPNLVADWNMNRYVDTTVTNTPSEDTDGNDIEMFPIESIVDPIRPTKGILKARIGESTIADDYETNWRPRFYVASITDKYKYWISPYRSDGSGNITGVNPQVIYAEPVAVNKIVIKVENTWASPIAHSVQVTTNGGSTWSTVSSSPTIRNDGQIILYWNGTSWSSTQPATLENTRTINGIRYVVTRLGNGVRGDGNPTTYRSGGQTIGPNGVNSHFSLIEISARLEMNLTDHLISVNDTFDTSEVSTLYPVGTLTSNVATVTLWNGDGYFSRDNAASPISKFLDANVEMNLQYIYHIDGSTYPVQQFKMYTGPWSGQKTETVSVELSDASKFFQETIPEAMMWQDQTLPEIIWRLCDSVGFVDYNNDVDDRAVEHTIPVFWTDGVQSLWEVLNELAKATQTTIYFDNNGVLQARTREAAFDDAKTPVWTLRGETSGTELADIVSMDQTESFDVNNVKVIYQTTKWEKYSGNTPAMRVVWEPEEEVVTLRASPLKNTLETTGPHILISAEDAVHWPYEGIVNVQGELIRYSGKRYVYYTGSNGSTANVATVRSQDELEMYERKTRALYRYKNHLNGALVISERGLWNSENKRHPVDAEGYNVRAWLGGSRQNNFPYGFRHDRHNSKIVLDGGTRFRSTSDTLYATRGNEVDTPFYNWGCMLDFVKEAGKTDQTAGIVICNNGTNDDGYFIELRATDMISAEIRKVRHELLVFSRKGGQHTRVGRSIGWAAAIAQGVEYTLDVHLTDNHIITVYVNGKPMMSTQIPDNLRNSRNGKFGVFAKGATHVQFEYLYAISRNAHKNLDDYSFLDRVSGDYTSSQLDRDWIFGWRDLTRRQKKNSTKNRKRWNEMVIDDFGPFAHEVREFDVRFDPAPTASNRVVMTNDYRGVVTEYRGDAMGAYFVVANSSRKNAVVHGPETLHYAGTTKEINHALTVIGQTLEIAEGEEVVERNEDQIRRRGSIEAEITSRWIQSKAAAKTIAKWVAKHWGNGTEQQTAVVFGNPLIEVGDIVSVNYPQKHMFAGTHRFFVTGASTSFSNGLTTTLTLRRVV